ncbi:MAG: hypothetical protein HC901_04190 [Bdellovibrionaceae bacterium]|nr:hypothetical protein [Pseudobdellovibrionaceae bacterium]
MTRDSRRRESMGQSLMPSFWAWMRMKWKVVPLVVGVGAGEEEGKEAEGEEGYRLHYGGWGRSSAGGGGSGDVVITDGPDDIGFGFPGVEGFGVDMGVEGLDDGHLGGVQGGLGALGAGVLGLEEESGHE